MYMLGVWVPEATPVASSLQQLRLRAARRWLGPRSVAQSTPAVHFHAEMMAGSPVLPKPLSWFVGPGVPPGCR